MTDDLTLIAGDREIYGWTDIRVSRGIERCPSDFDISLTERFPGEASAVVIQPGDPCMVMIGSDLVITGYIDRYMPSIEANSHTIRVSGRGKCQDLVDCNHTIRGCQISCASVLDIAKKLAAPYNISVSALTDVGGPIPQFNVSQLETPFEIIERICRYRALLAYDDTDGDLVLSRLGTTYAANGFEQGVNVQRAQALFSMDQRFSEYNAFLNGMDYFSELGEAGNLVFTAHDKAVPRFRRLNTVAEATETVTNSDGTVSNSPISQMRSEWECCRRFGRSQMVRLTTDTWRDAAGNLYTPNTLVPLKLPQLKIVDETWLIGEVSYIRGRNGTTCDLTIMPPSAFYPQPILLQPINRNDVPAFPAGQ